MALLRSESLGGVEGPLKWIQEYYQTSESLTERKLRSLMHLPENNLDNCVQGSRKLATEEFSYHVPKLNQFLFSKLNLAAVSIFLKDLERAQVFLHDGVSMWGRLSGDHRRIKRAINYVIDTLKWSISAGDSGPGFGDDVPVGLEKFATLKIEEGERSLQDRWSCLKRNKKSVAAVKFMKASLLLTLGVSAEVTIQELTRVTQLDPEYFVWHHYLYRLIRFDRYEGGSERKESDGKRDRDTLSREEREACITAYQLRPSVLLNIFNHAQMLKEYLQQRSSAPPLEGDTGQDSDLKLCGSLLRDAWEIAKSSGVEAWVEDIKLLEAFLHLYVKWAEGDVDAKAKGETLLLTEARQEFPESGKILRSVALYFQRQSRDAFRKAVKLANEANLTYKLALEKEPHNLSILKTYINFLNHHFPFARRSHYLELCTLVNKMLEKIQGLEEQAEVEILKGCLVWIYNPDKLKKLEENRVACDIWISVLKRFPEAADLLFEGIEDSAALSRGSRDESEISHFDLVLELNKIRQELERKPGHRDEATLQALFNLWVLGEMELPPPPPEPVEKAIAEENWKREMATKYTLPHQRNDNRRFPGPTPRSRPWDPPVSEADDNWRK